MDLPKIDLDPDQADTLYREYLAARHYSRPIDDEIRRVYREISKGGVVIRALDAIREAGVNAQGLPKLAIVRADREVCFLSIGSDGRAAFAGTERHLRRGNWGRKPASDMAFEFPEGTFPARRQHRSWDTHRAIAPLIPLKLRPKKGLEKYHILWEAEWTPHAPADPVLLRRLGAGDMWLVVAAWDLTPVEQAALTARIHA
jgi:hypothetical protein